MGHKSPYRHCQCSDHLLEVIVGMLEQAGRQDIAATLRIHKGKTLRSCQGTQLPPIQWSAWEAELRKLLEASMGGLLNEERPERVVEDYARELAGSIARSIKGMWELTLRSPPTQGGNFKPIVPKGGLH